MASKRITVSTAGIAKMIKKLGDDQVKFNLALSLHAANDAKRNQIMPINEANSLSALKHALQYYYQQTKTLVTFEYILFYQFNDSLEDAEELFQFTKHVPSKVNIIEYNPISEATFTNTDPLTEGQSRGLIFHSDKGSQYSYKELEALHDQMGFCQAWAAKPGRTPMLNQSTLFRHAQTEN